PRLDGTRPGHNDDFIAAHAEAIAQLDHGSLGPKTSPGQLVWRTDAVNFLDSRQQFKNANVEIDPRPDRAQHSHLRPGRAADLDSHLDEMLDHLLNERLIRAFLHRNNHRKSLLAFSCEQ